MKIAIITNCTSSSSIPVIPNLDGMTMPKGATHEQCAQEWKTRIDSAMQGSVGLATARAMYTGISFRSMLAATDQLHSSSDVEVSLFVASLGFGLVHADQLIASYNLNILPPNDSPSALGGIITAEVFEPVRWWAAINRVLGKPDPITAMIVSGKYDLILIALTNNFLGLCSADIASSAPAKTFDCVRIVGPKGATFFQKYMRHIQRRGAIMPYSKHLNDVIPGSRNDFAQRAASHYIKEVLIPANFKTTMAEDQAKVAALMTTGGGLAAQVSDEQLQEWVSEIKADPDSVGISASNAYTRVVGMAALKGTTIPFMRFQRVWGFGEAPPIDADELNDAQNALKMIVLSNNGDAAGASDQSASIATLRLFVTALRSQGGGVFTIRDVFNWSKTYFDRRKQTAPVYFATSNRLGRLLSTHHEELGLIQYTSAVGGKSYRAEAATNVRQA